MALREHALFRLYSIPPADAAQGGGYLDGSQGAGVDTGVLVAYEGTLCLSLNSLVELCEVAGFSFNAEARKLEAENAALQHALEQERAEKHDLEEQLNAVALAVAHAAAPEPRTKVKK